MSLNKTQRGRPLRIPAADYNAFVDAARAFRQSNLGGSGLRQSTPNPCVLLAKSATAYPRFAVVSVVDPISTPPGGETVDEGHAEEITVNVDAPAEGDRGIGIVIEPTTPDTLGRVIVSGVAQTFIEIVDESHGFAVHIADTTTHLQSATSGPIEIIWRGDVDDTAGIVPCIVRLGADTNRVAMFEILDIFANHLSCKMIDDPAESTVLVAKPTSLWHDLDRVQQLGLFLNLDTMDTVDEDTVDVAEGSVEEQWKVTPDYGIGDILLAVRIPNGFAIQVGDSYPRWMDVTGGRAWGVVQ